MRVNRHRRRVRESTDAVVIDAALRQLTPNEERVLRVEFGLELPKHLLDPEPVTRAHDLWALRRALQKLRSLAS